MEYYEIHKSYTIYNYYYFVVLSLDISSPIMLCLHNLLLLRSIEYKNDKEKSGLLLLS